MKKFITAFLLATGIIFYSKAQYCGNSGTLQCTPSGTLIQYGFGPVADSLPPFINGVVSTSVIQFKNLDTVRIFGQLNTVQSLRFDSIQNLPAGLCWATNKASNTYLNQEDGCIKINGTTCAPPGQYKLNVFVTVNVGAQVPMNASAINLHCYLRVKNSGDADIAVDTTGQANNTIAAFIPYGSSASCGGSSSITVIYPNGGETFQTGQNVNVAWSSTGNIPKVKIEFYSSIAFTWITLADSVANTGSYLFTIPQVPNMQGRIRISDPYNSAVNDQSDALFNIIDCSGSTLQIDSTVATYISCFGGNNGSACVYVSGGAPVYTYNWSNGEVTSCIGSFGLAAGTYAVTVVDNNFCSLSASVNVYQPTQSLNISLTPSNISCNGVNDGEVCVSVSGGTMPYLYNWSGGLFGSCPNGLVAGSYPITVSDANSCSASAVASITEPALLTVQVNSATGGVYPDTLCLIPIGGTAPFNFNWSGATNPPNAVFSCVEVTSSAYSFVVQDANGCSFPPGASLLSANAGPDINICFGDTSLFTLGGTPTASGGTPPYTYTWTPATALSCVTCPNPLTGGLSDTTIFLVTVTDNLGATATDTVTVFLNPALVIDSVTTTDVSCFGGSDGSVCVYVSGGAGVYSYQWSPLLMDTFCVNGLMAGNYSVTVTDAVGCSASAFAMVNEPTQLTAQIISANGSLLPDTLLGAANGGVVPYTFLWSIGAVNNPIEVSCPAVYWLTVTDYNGCFAGDSIFELDSCLAGCVWPGDADDNGIADNNDLLPIGLAYGNHAQADGRCDTSNAWRAQIAFDWLSYTGVSATGTVGQNTITLWTTVAITVGMGVRGSGIGGGAIVTAINGFVITLSVNNTANVSTTVFFTTPLELSGNNYKHIDCNGDWNINADDTLAILQNYGQTHAKTDEATDGWRMLDPALLVELSPDTTHAGDTMYADIFLGDINIPASNVYGLAFTLNYDALVVDSSKTKITFGSSWLGNTTDKISIAKDLKQSGQLKCAITRIDHANRSGFGQIGQAQFVITTDNINGKNMAYYKTHVWISDITMIDNLGNPITVNAGRDSSEVEFEPTGIDEIGGLKSDIRLMPNPANEEVLISVTENLIGGEMKVLDVEGRILTKLPISTLNFELRTFNFAQGIYFIQVITEKGMLTKRLVIAR